MIRPFTCVCALLAGGSGLYLYSEKHRTTLLDQQISKIVSDTEHTRERTAMLRAEWALLNQPDRLQGLASRFLPQLGAMAPTQFVQLASLEKRLPAPGPETPAHPIATPTTAPGLVGQNPAAAAPAAPDTASSDAGVAIAQAQPRGVARLLPAHGAAPAAAVPRPPVQLADAETEQAMPAAPRHAVAHVPVREAARHPIARAAPVRLAALEHEPAQRYRPAVTSVSSYARPQVIAAASWRPAHATWPMAQPAAYASPVGSSLGAGHAALPAPVPLSDGN